MQASLYSRLLTLNVQTALHPSRHWLLTAPLAPSPSLAAALEKGLLVSPVSIRLEWSNATFNKVHYECTFHFYLVYLVYRRITFKLFRKTIGDEFNYQDRKLTSLSCHEQERACNRMRDVCGSFHYESCPVPRLEELLRLFVNPFGLKFVIDVS